MKLLVEVIKMVAKKYVKDVNLIILDKMLILKNYSNKNDGKQFHKTIKIEEFEDKLKLTFTNEKIEKIVDIKELEDIIIIFIKQNKNSKLTQEQIKYIKDKYIAGTKIELIKMYDYINPVPPKTKGIIRSVDDMGTIQVTWENGSSLGLVVGIDKFKILERGQQNRNI